MQLICTYRNLLNPRLRLIEEEIDYVVQLTFKKSPAWKAFVII
jgi:hypothetical protein